MRGGPVDLLRESDAIYGADFQREVDHMGVRQDVIAPRASWQNTFAVPVSGAVRRDCRDHVIVLNELHLRCLARVYLAYYDTTPPHQGLVNDSPSRRVRPPGSPDAGI